MAETVIHEQVHDDTSSNTGIILAIVFLLLFVLLIIFGFPLVRNMGSSMTPQVNVPNHMDVNVHGSGSTGGSAGSAAGGGK